MTIQGSWAPASAAGPAVSSPAGHHRRPLTSLLLLVVPAPAVAADEDDVEQEQQGADGRHADDGGAGEGRAAGVVPVSDVADRRRTWPARG